MSEDNLIPAFAYAEALFVVTNARPSVPGVACDCYTAHARYRNWSRNAVAVQERAASRF